MKTSTIPSIRVEPAFRLQAEQVLRDDETLSGFVETAMAEAIQRRVAQRDFIARGIAARDEADRTGSYRSAADVHKEIAALVAESLKGKK